ncbi:isoprenoid synthase domain-containing protein [Mycena rosella]|uniref:Isoprenoid synthase domain-containing protein n=1 Tax=Mycena rosella TaxID=1033263 RepID=A0AAD7GB68_MYCRO|nr:isoprenoid synthase domain-containing protein [Mycena rosella]
MPPDAIAWYDNNLDYNVPGGKLNRGISVVDSAEIFKGATLDDDEYYKAAVLGWGVELASDIMDSSITRRGQPCYYLAPGIGQIAINDSFMLEGAIYYLLKKHFRSTPYYMRRRTRPRWASSSTSKTAHRLIVIFKTAYYSFYLPVALAMYMSGVPQSYTLDGKTIEPYKIQDDFLDFSAPPEQLGKIGTDIVDNKYSSRRSLSRRAQRAVLDENYGRKDAAAEARCSRPLASGSVMPKGPEHGTLKREIFTSFLEKIYK